MNSDAAVRVSLTTRLLPLVAALALVAAWAMRDVLGRRKGREDDADLLGVLAIASLLVLLPVASTDAHALAGLGGGIAGIVMGLLLARRS
jgi:drug/metabolite transporter (DMT)-like permease